MIEIKEVVSKKEIKEFLEFPNQLYKGNSCYVPSLYSDEKKMFSKNYMYYDQSESKFWNAYKDGKIVGRIQAILQKAANKKWNQKRVRFTRFDSIDDQEVANALLDKVSEYTKEKGMDEIVGPLNFSDLEREGLLIEGFDQLNTFEEQYNFEYYQKLIENYGFEKEVDWLEHRLFVSKEPFEKLYRLEDKLLERFGYKLIKINSYRKYCKRYGDQFFEMLDETYDKIYGTVPFTEGMKKLVMNNFSSIANMNYVVTVVDKNNKIIAFGAAFPSISEELLNTGGHLNLITALKILHTAKHPKRVDLGLVGVTKEGKLTGAAAIVFAELAKQMEKDNLEYYETNLNLEDNKEILGMWTHFENIQHKRRRCYVKKVN